MRNLSVRARPLERGIQPSSLACSSVRPIKPQPHLPHRLVRRRKPRPHEESRSAQSCADCTRLSATIRNVSSANTPRPSGAVKLGKSATRTTSRPRTTLARCWRTRPRRDGYERTSRIDERQELATDRRRCLREVHRRNAHRKSLERHVDTSVFSRPRVDQKPTHF